MRASPDIGITAPHTRISLWGVDVGIAHGVDHGPRMRSAAEDHARPYLRTAFDLDDPNLDAALLEDDLRSLERCPPDRIVEGRRRGIETGDAAIDNGAG